MGNFELSSLFVIDKNKNSLATTGIAWAPLWELGQNWTARPLLGGHFLRAYIGRERETFLVYNLIGRIGHHFSQNFSVTAGLGIQYWGASEKKTYGVNHLGLSWDFKWDGPLKVIKKAFLSLSWINNADENLEIRLGISIGL